MHPVSFSALHGAELGSSTQTLLSAWCLSMLESPVKSWQCWHCPRLRHVVRMRHGCGTRAQAMRGPTSVMWNRQFGAERLSIRQRWAACTELEATLRLLGAAQLVVGHTPQVPLLLPGSRALRGAGARACARQGAGTATRTLAYYAPVPSRRLALGSSLCDRLLCQELVLRWCTPLHRHAAHEPQPVRSSRRGGVRAAVAGLMLGGACCADERGELRVQGAGLAHGRRHVQGRPGRSTPGAA